MHVAYNSEKYRTYKKHPYEFQMRNRSSQLAIGTYDTLALTCSDFSHWLTLCARGFSVSFYFDPRETRKASETERFSFDGRRPLTS